MEAPPPYSEQDPSDTTRSISSAPSVPVSSPGLAQSRHTPSSEVVRQDIITDLTADTRVPLGASHSNFVSEYDHLASSSAEAYFESRPTYGSPASAPTTHSITVTDTTQPSELLYPPEFQSHDVLESDWLTFVNFLLPNHVLNTRPGVIGDADSAGSGQDAQRRGIDSKGDGDPLTLEARPQQECQERIQNTLTDWNHGFFNPRGLHISLTTAETHLETSHTPSVELEQPVRMPGTWIPYDHEIIGESSSAGRRRGFFRGFQTGSHGGFRMGPIIADNEGFRMGNIFRADQRGLRVGGSKGFVADDNGVSMGGRSFFRREANEPDRERAVPHNKLRKPNRSASMSSVSSTMSEDSTESEASSCGSMPYYDDLEDRQLIATQQSLLKLLYQSDKPLDKAAVLQARTEIDINSTQARDHQAIDYETLRREVKDLLRAFRERKRREKTESRQAYRAKRALRKARRKERHETNSEALRSKREKKNGKMKEHKKSAWTTSRTNLELPIVQPPPMPPRPALSHVPGFPFARAASVPSLRPHSQHSHDLSASPEHAHEIAAGRSSRTNSQSPRPTAQTSPDPIPGAYPQSVLNESDILYARAHGMDELAWNKHERAVWLQKEAASRECNEFERAKRLRHAKNLDEEASRYWLEAEMLRAEALEIDMTAGHDGRHRHGPPIRTRQTLPIHAREHWPGA